MPRAVEASRSLIDWLWPTWPELRHNAAAGHVDLRIAEDLQDPVLLVFMQTAEGQRTIQQKVQLRPGADNRVAGLPKLADDQRTVIVLRARRGSGEPLILEHVLGADSKTFGVVPAPAPPAPAPPAPAPPEPEAAPPPPVETPEEETNSAEDVGWLPMQLSPGEPKSKFGTPALTDKKPVDKASKPARADKPAATASKPASDAPVPKDSKPTTPAPK